jgi:outer membrane receptor protein involved in Fe transport
MRRFLRHSLMMGALIAPGVVFGQAAPQPEAPVATPAPESTATPGEIPELPPVVVSATRTERSLADLPVSATVISREDIMNSPGRSIEENLRALAGVELPFDNSAMIFPLQPSIAIREGVGDTATRALVLLDGIPINGGFFGNVFWNRVPKEVVERVEVVRGASSSLYGSYALGGVDNIVTRVPTDRSAVLDASYGQQNTVSSNVWLSEVPASKKAALGFNGNFYQTDGFFRHDDRPPVEDKQSAQLYNLQARGDLAFTPAVKGFLRAGYNHQELDGPFLFEKADTAIVDVSTGLDIDAGQVGNVVLRGFYANENFHVDNVSVPEPTLSFVSNTHHTTSNDYGLSGQWSKGFGWLGTRVTAGVDFRQIRGEDDQDIFNTPAVLFGQRLEAVVVVLGLTSWPWIARVARAQTLSLRSREFVDAARALGASTPRILLRQILPHALPATVVVASLNAAGIIVLEAGLSFLGLGDPSRMSWGYLANNAQKFLRIAWWMAAFPGAAIALAVLGLNLLGAVIDLLDPGRR